MATYHINLEEDNLLRVDFGEDSAQNDKIVQDVKARLDEMIDDGTIAGGSIIKINGLASLPVAVAISHAVMHRYETVAVFDPKLGQYVVAVSHGDSYEAGDLID